MAAQRAVERRPHGAAVSDGAGRKRACPPGRGGRLAGTRPEYGEQHPTAPRRSRSAGERDVGDYADGRSIGTSTRLKEASEILELAAGAARRGDHTGDRVVRVSSTEGGRSAFGVAPHDRAEFRPTACASPDHRVRAENRGHGLTNPSRASPQSSGRDNIHGQNRSPPPPLMCLLDARCGDASFRDC